MAKTTLSDIAQSLGLSVTLVSMVVNNKADRYGISKETQEKVWAKIKEMNYRPNLLAQGFRTGKTHTLGLIVSDISNRFYARIARNIEDLAWQHGYTVIICSTDENTEKEVHQINMLIERKVDGLIVSSSQPTGFLFEELASLEYPFVLIDRFFDNPNLPAVTVNNYHGAQLAVEHLSRNGYRHIGLVSITPIHISTISERKNGFFDTLKTHNLPLNREWIIDVPFNDVENSIYQKIKKLKYKNKLPDAIFSLNNTLTSATIQALRKLSIDIPQEVALIGFDDMHYFSFSKPSISAIDQPIEEISRQAFNMLLKQLSGDASSKDLRSISIDVELKIRESSVRNRNEIRNGHLNQEK